MQMNFSSQKLLTTITFITLFNSFLGYGQSFQVPDSLEGKTYGELYDSFMINVDSINQKAEIYAKTYLEKGLIEKNKIQTAWGYYLLAILNKKDSLKSITFLDSVISYSQDLNDNYFPAVIFINKGLIKERQGLFTQAIDNYLKAIEFSKRSKNNHLLYTTKHNIALLKRKLGRYEEAKSIFKECLNFEAKKVNRKINDSISYLITLSELITTYRFNKEIDSAFTLINKGIQYSKKKNGAYLFLLEDGIQDYHNQNYESALQKINSTIPLFFEVRNEEFFESYNLIEAYLYLGKTYRALLDDVNSIQYYKKADSLIQSIDYVIPENRAIYIELINYYKFLNEKENQLIYINKLLLVDSVLNTEYKLINDRIIKEYDTPKLIAEKEQIIASLEKENTKKSFQNIIISVLLVISVLGIGFYYYKQRLYKRRFLKLLEEKNIDNQKKDQSNDGPSGSSSISKETLKNLLDKLQQFEEKQDYLKPNLNTKDLAKSFGSNSSYLSKVVNSFKEKSFSSYINDLRIDFVIDKLKSDAIYRKYTIKAIAQEIGFNNPEAFSKAFYKKTGIYPSYFLKELERQTDVN